MINVYNASTLLGSYSTKSLPSSGFFASTSEGDLFQAPLSEEAQIKQTVTPIALNFSITFLLKAATVAESIPLVYEARANFLQATSIEYEEGGLWRALWGDERNLVTKAFYPQRSEVVDKPYLWEFTLEFNPLFPEPTVSQAETYSDYLAALGDLPINTLLNLDDSPMLNLDDSLTLEAG